MVMGMREAHGHAPGPIILAARIVVNLTRRMIGNLVVVFHLVGDFGHARACDRPHVVIPPLDPLARFAIIRGPAEIRWVNIRCHAFFKPMQLIRPDKMHLAAQAGLIARTS